MYLKLVNIVSSALENYQNHDCHVKANLNFQLFLKLDGSQR